MQIQEATAAQLPPNTTHGFKVLGADGETLLFFHWHEQPIEVQLLYDDLESNEKREHQVATSYADVLAALPDRLAAMGLEDEVNAIMGEIVGRFGTGS